MKKDARLLLNKKKWNQSQRPDRFRDQSQTNRGLRTKVAGRAIDARKILNLKRASKSVPQKGNFLRSSKPSTSGLSIVKKSFPVLPKAPEKRVQLASDGNIWITAKAKDAQGVAKSQRFPPNPNFTRPQPNRMQWTPADVDMDNLEHVGIDDLIDMESLPTAMISSNPPRNELMSPRSLAQEVLSMQNTMVADQVASTSAYQNACVIVTNLRASVTKQDLLELFGDIGLVKNAEMKHPGTAFVEFYSVEDASQACSIYHNRLLDGQPMKCYLQAGPSPQRTSVSQRLGERIQTITSVPLASSSSLSSNPRSRYNPRDVRFTVKLG